LLCINEIKSFVIPLIILIDMVNLYYDLYTRIFNIGCLYSFSFFGVNRVRVFISK